MSNQQDIQFETKIVEKIQMRKIIFAFFDEKNENILTRANRKLKICPKMKSFIAFVSENFF